MKRKKYSAGGVKVAFWFQEFRRMVELLADGKTYGEIRDLNEAENIFGASTKTRRTQIFNTLSARTKSLDKSFFAVFLNGDISAQKQLALAAVMAQDTLFFEFVYEVIHEKIILANNELSDADMSIFFHQKQVQDERAAKWTEATLKRLGSTYRSILTEVGMLEKSNQSPRKIYPLFLDFAVENWLKEHDMAEVVRALSDH